MHQAFYFYSNSLLTNHNGGIMIKLKSTLFLLTILLTVSLVAQDSFVRSAVIDPPSTYPSGFGATVSGVDLDGDGKLEIYSVDGMTDFMTGDEIPQIIKYERNGTAWDSVWAASLPNENQNTWASLTVGDLDGDSKQEIIWGFTNSFSVNTTPPRIVVFEANGDDVLGVSDGAGNYNPNAQWDFALGESINVRPLKWHAYDIDGDGAQEVIFADRRTTLSMGVISVTDIPDAGGASETWSLEMTNETELYNKFARSNVIESPDGGFGGLVTGMDYDNDGLMDLYTVNDNWGDGPNGELIPMLYKYELVSGAWVLRWSTSIPGIDFQNTWPVLTAGDWDNDGKGEIQWCPINNFGAGNEDPSRIVVYEFPGDSTSDAMGVDQLDGTWAPNAAWNMDVDSSTSMRPFRGQLVDIDNDGALEFVFTERHNYYVWGVVGVTDIPDNGDGSEVWALEANGVPDAGSDYRDIVVIDQTVYLFGSGGEVRTITNDGTSYTVSDPHQAYPGWSWLSANTVDIDGDGTMEIVTGDYASAGSGSVWILMEDADSLVGYKVADFSANTANRITNVRVGDINADGMVDFVVGFRGSDEVHRVSYNGGDITLEASYTTSLLDKGVLGAEGIGQMDMILVADIDGSGADEVLYTGIPRNGLQPLTVGSYTDTLKLDGGARWDITIANDAIHVFDGDGNLQRVDYANDQWNIYPAQNAIVNGAFLTASTTDIEGDGVEEIMVGNWYDAKVNMLKWINGAWVATVVADFTDVGGTRLNGGAVGDIDGDGNMDFVTGSRGSVPNGQIYRVEYTGGDVMDAASWMGEVIDVGMNEKFSQYEVINIANLDDDADLEVLYTSDYARGTNTADDAPFPIVILDLQKIISETIASVKVDADGDFVADRVGDVVTVKGVIISPTINSLFSLSINIQDETGGINIYSEVDSIYTTVGDLVQITGEVDNYNGLTQIVVANEEDIVRLGTGTIPVPMVVTVADIMTDGEKYESMLIKVNAIEATGGGDAWPTEGNNANITMTDGYMNFTMRVDKDLELDGQTEPVYPANVTGVLGQYDSNTPPNAGYQLFPRYYDDIEQNAPAPPSPYFFFTDETAAAFDGKTVAVNSNDEEFTFVWDQAVDLNGDNLIYQLQMIVDGASVDFNAADTFMVLTGQQIISALSNTSQTVDITVRTKGSESALVPSVDTLSVTFDILVGVDEESIIPKEFFVDQNYPNPFNPTTNIKFGLPAQAEVNLIIYDILGREVARLVNNQIMNAGTYEFSYDASNLASGTYIYRLQADQKVEVKKMMLLK
jgi:DNA/RNA endonuclease YhcR with UshA esterase domain